MSNVWALLLSVALLAGNGFFVAAEFAVVAAKKYRLDAAAEEGSRSARRAALAKDELPLMLAGAQLGITLCSLGLGALAEPAIAHLIDPLLHRIGIPATPSYIIGFVVALAIVVFLHMVVGEMAPKSWVITHPERSALILIWPFAVFTRTTRILLVGLNTLANTALRLVRVRVSGALPAAQGPGELRILLSQSAEHGTLAQEQHALLSGAIAIHGMSIAGITVPIVDISAVATSATSGMVEQVSYDTGRSRLLVTDQGQAFVGVVHIRDVLTANLTSVNTPVTALMTPPLRLAAATHIHAAISEMKTHRAQLALVTRDGADIGLIAMEDLLEQVIGQFDDETDTPTPPGMQQLGNAVRNSG